MAEEVQIRGSSEVGKLRNPLAPALLPFITLGIYTIFWYYYTQKELAEMGRARGTTEMGDNPVTSVLAVTLGIFILVPPFVSLWNAWGRLNAAQRATGQEETSQGLGFLVTLFVSPIAWYLYQDAMNKVLQQQAQA